MIVINDELHREKESILMRLEELMRERTFVTFRCYLDQRDREIRGIVTRVDRGAGAIKLSHDEGFDIIELSDMMSIDFGNE